MPVVAFDLTNACTTYRKIHHEKTAIGQCLVQAERPWSVIPPLLFWLGVEFDHMFGFKWLINELFLKYPIFYDEVTRFKQNSIISSNFEDVLPKYSGSVTQWVDNNVDHNIGALDGKITFSMVWE